MSQPPGPPFDTTAMGCPSQSDLASNMRRSSPPAIRTCASEYGPICYGALVVWRVISDVRRLCAPTGYP